MTKYKLTHKTYYSPFWFCKSEWPNRVMNIELIIDNKKERDEIERYLRSGHDDVFEWEFISKSYNLGNCGVK